MKDISNAWNLALQTINQTLGIPANASPPIIEYHSALHAVGYKNPARLIVLNGPAGAGKSTIGKLLGQLNYHRIPRLTTRPMRYGEQDGVDYYFVSQPYFNNELRAGNVLAAKTTYGHHRGFLANDLEHAMLGDKFYMEGDSSLQAIWEFKDSQQFNLMDVLNIFILPPDPKSWVGRVESQMKAGHFSTTERNLRVQEGIQYIQTSAKRYQEFPRSLYVSNDNLERIEPIIRHFANEPGAASLHPLQNNTLIGTKSYAHTHGILHPIVIVYIQNDQGQLLIQRRVDTQQWDHSAAGHTEIGETPEQAVRRELQEELGVVGDVTFIAKVDELRHPLIPKTTRHTAYIYKAQHNGPFSLQESEVAEVKFINLQTLRADMTANPTQYSAGMIASLLHAYPYA